MKIFIRLRKLVEAIRRPQQPARIGIFIDCDGVSAAGATKVINWVEKLGRLDILRAYGNFSGKSSAEWVALLASRRLVARHLPNLVTGKNASDIALAIDAVEMALTRDIDIFVLAVSDSDYAPLAIRLREAGKHVLGIGHPSTPEAFRSACTEFHVLASLRNDLPAARKPLWTRTAAEAEDVILAMLSQLAPNEQPVSLSLLGSALKEQNPLFDPRVYNHNKLTDLIAAIPSIEMLEVPCAPACAPNRGGLAELFLWENWLTFLLQGSAE